MKSILAITEPNAAATAQTTAIDPLPSTVTPQTPGTSDPVSKHLGTASDDYQLTKVLFYVNPASPFAADVPAGNGLAMIPMAAAEVISDGTAPNAVHDKLALSITDFNIFRIRVASAINSLDAKIREVTQLTDDLGTC